MPVYVALLQGVNVGPKKRIRMESLRALISGLGGSDVRTYVNSGNAVFRHEEKDAPALERRIEDALLAHVGMEVPTILRTSQEMDGTVARNPFPDAVSDPKMLHVLFLRGTPAMADVNVAEEIETGDDRIAILGQEVYAFLPNYTSGATVDLMAVAKALQRVGTSRNWNSVTKLAAMATAFGADGP